MAHAQAAVDLPVGVHEAWAAVVDWDRQSEWMLLTRVRATAQGGEGVGGRASARTAVGPVGFTDDMEIIAWDPPYRCRVRHLGRVVRGEGAFAVDGLGPGRSRFTWTEELILGRLGVAWPLVRPGFELFMRMSLRRLTRRLVVS
jgi:Polyketide cyclase / dehydrase and lipid transport